MPKITAIAFDIDGTLYPEWHLLATSLGFYIRNFHLVQRYWKIRNNLREEDYHYEAEGREGLLQHQAQIYAELTKKNVADIAILLEQKIYHTWEKTFRHIRPLPGVQRVLKELKQRGFAVAVM